MERLKIKRTANSNLQNEINISVIFNFLRSSGPSYRAQISKALNISAPAVSRVIEHLVEKEYLIEEGLIKTEYGKSAAKVMINADIGFIIAVDLVKDQARFAVTNFSGAIQEKFSGFRITDSGDLKHDLLSEISNINAKYIGKTRGTIGLKAICVGIPAATDLRTGMLNTVLYENLENLDIKSLLTETFDVPVYIENISNLSAIGESNYGAGKDFTDIIFLEISNGIGAGIISQNRLLRGRSGYAGEIGYSLIDKDDLDTFKQRKGSLERVASIDSMVYDLKRELEFGAESVLAEEPEKMGQIGPAEIFRAAMTGDKLSRRIIERAVKHVSICITNLILTLDPEIIFLGGDIYHMPDVNILFLKPVIDYVTNVLPFPPPSIRLSSLGEDAGIIGASYMAIETLLTGKYPYTIEDV